MSRRADNNIFAGNNQNVDYGNLSALSCHDGKGGVSSGRVSTKVHAPPGGKSSFSIGGGYEDEAPAHNNRYSGRGNASSISFGASDEPAARAPARNPNASSFSFGSDAPVAAAPVRQAAASSWQQQPQQQEYNNLSALSCHDGKGGVSSGRVSTKVHAPPGGKSSFSIGGGYEDETPAHSSRFSGRGNVSSISFGASDEPAARAPARNPNASSFSLGQQQQPQQDYSNLAALSCHDGKGGVSSGKFSTKVHAPPGGRSQISFY